MKKIEPNGVVINKRIINSETVANNKKEESKPDVIMVSLTDDPNWLKILRDKDDSFDSIDIVNSCMYIYKESSEDNVIIVGSIFLETKRLFFRAIHGADPKFNSLDYTTDRNMEMILPIVEASIYRILNDNIKHTNITVYRNIIRDLLAQILEACNLKANENMMKELDYFIKYYIQEVLKLKTKD